MGANPITTAEQLVREIDRALAQLTLAAARRADLEKLRTTASDLHAQLRFFDREYVPLDLNDGDARLLSAVKQWNAVPPGVVRDGEPLLERTITQSACLQPLYRAGITIKAIKKFGEQEIAFATVLGDNFAQFSGVWQELKSNIDKREPVLRFPKRDLHSVRAFVAQLERLDVATVTGFEVPEPSDTGNPSWIPLDERQAGKYEPNTPMRVRLKSQSTAMRSLVTGEWLNAYAAKLVSDHLTRNGLAHEIYTNVAYQAPLDIINVSSDFDVLVQAEHQVAVFECKSGRLVEADYRSLVQKSSGLTRVFQLTRTRDSLATLLLYNPSATSPERVANGLAGSGIIAVTPDQVRSTLITLFSTGPGGGGVQDHHDLRLSRPAGSSTPAVDRSAPPSPKPKSKPPKVTPPGPTASKRPVPRRVTEDETLSREAYRNVIGEVVGDTAVSAYLRSFVAAGGPVLPQIVELLKLVAPNCSYAAAGFPNLKTALRCALTGTAWCLVTDATSGIRVLPRASAGAQRLPDLPLEDLAERPS